MSAGKDQTKLDLAELRRLVNLMEQRELAEGISGVCADTQLAELDCIRGHDSFLVDMDAFRPVIWDFLKA